MGEEKNRYTLIQHVEESLFTWVTSWYIGPLKSSTWVEYLRVAESTPNGVDSLRDGRVACRTGVEVGPHFAVPIRRLLGFSQSRRADRTRFFADVFCAFGCQAGPFYSMRVLHFRVAPRCCSGRCKGFAVVLVVLVVWWFGGVPGWRCGVFDRKAAPWWRQKFKKGQFCLDIVAG